MSSSEHEPRLPWLLSLTGAEGVPLITHTCVAILFGLVAFDQLVLALPILPSRRLQACRTHPCDQSTCSEQQVTVVLHSLGKTGMCRITVPCCSEQVSHCVQSVQSLCLQENMARLDWSTCTCNTGEEAKHHENVCLPVTEW